MNFQVNQMARRSVDYDDPYLHICRTNLFDDVNSWIRFSIRLFAHHGSESVVINGSRCFVLKMR